ncbi:nucleic acid-binding protein [Linderina pennispora]|uniref:DNA replication licensing factor MCM4 n=1 Tax=Linderina pennispora TaxID=61395 RepID=A0A1Y1W1V8_9FUNG|nr:nucleic acid-binding protein [Linderina pennispora]ORX67226.1 nucleic acid-binding protein [Linderina pennispora]
MAGIPPSSPPLGHGSDDERMGSDAYNTLPETPAPFSPLARQTGPAQRAAPMVGSSSPQLGFSDMPSTGMQFGLSSQASVQVLSSQLGAMAIESQTPSAHRRGDLGSRAHALSSELGSMVSSQGVQPQEIRTIWGTIVHVRDTILSESERMEPVYPQMLQRMHDSEIFQLNLDAQNLRAYAPSQALYRQLVNYPEEVVPIMDYVLTELFLEQFPDADLAQTDLKVRPYNLSVTTNMRELNPSDIDKLVSVRGLLIRSSAVIPDMERAFFRCLQCDWTTTVTEPTQCGNAACLQKDAIELVHNRCTFADKQLARLQETPEVIPDGQTPHTVTLVMHDELVDASKPGDRLEITGVYRGVPVRTNPRNRTVQAIYRTYIDVVHVRRLGRSRAVVDVQRDVAMAEEGSGEALAFTQSEVDEFRRWARDPRLFDILIYEMEDVKRGLLLQLFGGVRKQFARAGAPRSRGDINVLIVGDPVHGLAPRGIYTSGKGSSATRASWCSSRVPWCSPTTASAPSTSSTRCPRPPGRPWTAAWPATLSAEPSAEDLPVVPTEKLTRYIAYARRHVTPQITDAAADALVAAYVDLRRMGRDASSTTAGAVAGGNGRLESMIRMAEAHAKMRLSDSASRLMREALRESATDPRTGLIDLDLLNTGFAASDRRQLDSIKREARNMLVGAARASVGAEGALPDAPHAGNSATYQTWLDRPERPVAVRELQTEGLVNLVGTGRNMLIVVKQSALNN